MKEAPMSALRGKRAVVTGGSRGLGRGIVAALAAEGADVVAIARDAVELAAMAGAVEGHIETIAADTTDVNVAARTIEKYQPQVLILNAGATSVNRPLRFQVWENFSLQFQVDVKGAFVWSREALLLPLEKGSTIVVMSSAAALASSQVITGYASAKAALLAFARCLADEARGFGIRVHCLLPMLTPETQLGQNGIRDFARAMGVPEATFIEQKGVLPPVTPEIVGRTVVNLLTDPAQSEVVGFRITGTQVTPI
jgi:NAD(P)-dependent dehydrogenase (short-subunit alcohol dehydrogenase family)